MEEQDVEENIMTLEIGNMQIEIPEKLIEERARMLHINSKKENLEDIKYTIVDFLQCLTTNELKNKKLIQEKVINHLISEMELYK